MNVSAKYLKDENGKIFSPIVSSDTIFLPNGTKLDLSGNTNIDYKILWQGSNMIPCRHDDTYTGLQLSDSIYNYSNIIVGINGNTTPNTQEIILPENQKNMWQSTRLCYLRYGYNSVSEIIGFECRTFTGFTDRYVGIGQCYRLSYDESSSKFFYYSTHTDIILYIIGANMIEL